MPFVGTHARDLDDAVGAEGGDDVVGATVVEREGVRGDGGADPFGDVVPTVVSATHQKPRSSIGCSKGYTLTAASAGSSRS